MKTSTDYKWNNKKYERHYNRIKENALDNPKYEFTEEELSSPYLDSISHQTRSYRIMRMVVLAYYLGKLKGIREVDAGETPVTLD